MLKRAKDRAEKKLKEAQADGKAKEGENAQLREVRVCACGEGEEGFMRCIGRL